MKDRFDVSVACDTDHDRHGIVTRSQGLMPPNHYLAVAASYLIQHRPSWSLTAGIGKTVVTSQMIEQIATKHKRPLCDVPVGFKWFVPGLLNGSLAFAGEESAGASCARRDGHVWTTDKDGLVPALLAAEITARMGRDPGEYYQDLTREFHEPFYDRMDVPATAEQKDRLAAIDPHAVTMTTLAGEPITEVLTRAPGNGEPIGGVKIRCASGWIAARPSGTEALYKIYAESFQSADHLRRLIADGQALVATVLGAGQTTSPSPASGGPSGAATTAATETAHA
jgi:phosphoglucomutase